jgi:hypothetical protein
MMMGRHFTSKFPRLPASQGRARASWCCIFWEESGRGERVDGFTMKKYVYMELYVSGCME